MRNQGVTTWTRDTGYKLGANEDSDPFYFVDTRVWLPESASVPPGTTYSFQFDLHAPVGPGEYMTDWRMVEEGVEWFGAVASQNVIVSCPGTSTSSSSSSSAAASTSTSSSSSSSVASSSSSSTGGGQYVRGPLDFDIQSPANARRTNLVFDPTSQAYVTIFTDVDGATGNHRTRVRTVRWNGGAPAVGGGDILDEPVAVHTLEPDIAAGGGRLLAVWEDARLGGGNGGREIFGQFLTVDGNGVVSLVGANFNISNIAGLEEYSPCVGYEPSQGFIVAWSDTRELGLRPDGRILLARMISVDGTIGPEMRLGDANNWQMLCSVSAGGGRLFVTWSDYVDLGGGNLDIGYRGAVVTGGQPAAPMTVARVGGVPPDHPHSAWSAVRQQWLVAYSAQGNGREVRGALVNGDGTVAVNNLPIGINNEGAGVPYVAWNAITDTWLVTYHAWITNDAFSQELHSDASPFGGPLSVNAAPPTLGTFHTPVASSTTEARFLVVPMQNYNRVAGTFYSAQ